jgi:muconolactone delta-isomerase
MEFLVEFEIHVPAGTPEAEVGDRERAEASAAARLVADGHLLRVWTRADTTLGLYRAGSETELDRLLDALPLREWMNVTVTPLGPHPNDPAAAAPRLTPVYRLDATVGEPLDLGEAAQGRRRIVPLTGGTFTGPRLSGTLVPGASADWQIVLPDGTALGEIRYTLRTDGATCSTSGRRPSATVRPRSSLASPAARTSMPASTRSAPRRGSKRRRPPWTGSTKACSSRPPPAPPRA